MKDIQIKETLDNTNNKEQDSNINNIKDEHIENDMTKKVDKEQECDYIYIHEDVVKEVTSELPKEEKLYELADFFKVFADSTRIKILYVLSKHEMCVCDIALLLKTSQSAISHQLRMLKQMKLVKNRRDGKSILYSLSDHHIESIISQGLEHINE